MGSTPMAEHTEQGSEEGEEGPSAARGRPRSLSADTEDPNNEHKIDLIWLQ